MMKRALIICSGHNPLPGFATSAACITQALRARGFEITSCDGPGATRAEILRAYDELTSRADSTDAIVVYYVGHGGLVTNPSYTHDGDLPLYIQHVCPTDFAQTTEDDFRGISALELSLQLAALTRKTRNSTIILECCFAAQMSRGDDPPTLARIPPTLTRAGLVNHFQDVRRRYPDLAVLSPTGNPDAVRVAATGQVGAAYHVSVPPPKDLQAIGIDLPGGGWIGAMTLGLVQILAEIRDTRVTWRAVGEALRARLYVQRPEIEGPTSRVPFSMCTVDAAPFGVRAAPGGSGAIVDAGRLHGVSVGDVYCVMPAGSTQLDPAMAIADITIDEANAIDSRAGHIDWRPGNAALPANAVAIPRSLAFEPYPVRVVADDVELPMIAAALRGSPTPASRGARRIRAATPEDRDSLAELRVRDNTVELRDQFGPLFPPAPYPDRLLDAVQDLENLATARRLRVMADEQGIAHADVSVELLAVDTAGNHRVLADHGSALGLADRLAVRLLNRTDAPLFAHIFNIGLRCRIAMLSDAGGIHLMPDMPTYGGSVGAGRLIGFRLRWPPGMPRDQPRTDTVMIIVTREAADLGALAGNEHLAWSRAPISPLAALFGHIARGGSRGDDEAPPQPPGAFAIHWRTYQLHPIASFAVNHLAPRHPRTEVR